MPRTRVTFGEEADSSLSAARQRASRAITEDTVFDFRGSKIPKAGISLTQEVNGNSFEADVRLKCFDF